MKLSKDHVAAVNRRRRVIVNYDSLCGFGPFICDGVTPQQLVDYRFSLIDHREHAIDSVMWCFSEGNEAPYPSKVVPMFCLPKYKKWAEQGIDIVDIFITETRKRGLEAFFSYRMNGSDMDYASSFLKNLGFEKYVVEDVDLVPMKQHHPDWLMQTWLKGPTREDVYCQLWNYAEPGVREYRLACFSELAENYELDGFELDFARGKPFFPIGQQWLHRDALTDLVRSIRLMTLEIEKKRGRPFLLAARVPESIDTARLDGMDLETWAREQLLDIYIPGTRSIEVDVESYRRITAGSPARIYPCLDGHHSADGYGNPTIQIMRGLATNWIDQGADGIETFNFINITRQSCEAFEKDQLMRGVGTTDPGAWDTQDQAYAELGWPDRYAGRDKTFVVGRRGGGAGANKMALELSPAPENWNTPKWGMFDTNAFAQLPAPLANKPDLDTFVYLHVGDNVNACVDHIDRVTLRLLLSDPDAESLPDEQRLPQGTVRARYTKLGYTGNIRPARGIEAQIHSRVNGVLLPTPTPTDDGWLAWNVPARTINHGRNLIAVRINDRDQTQDQIIIEKVELNVRYHDSDR